MSEPEDITIIVHGARGLQGRKSGRHKFSVIFGVGSKKYRTDVVKDPTGCPDFNEEIVVPTVNPGDSVFFTVTEKDDILGQLSIPLSSLQSTKGRILRAVLLPHRKCPRPQGELIYQCYVSRYRTSPSDTRVSQNDSFSSRSSEPRGGFSKFKHTLATTPILPRKLLRRHKRSDSSVGGGNDRDRNDTKPRPLSTLNQKFSKSLHDLINFARGVSEPNDQSVEKNSRGGGVGGTNLRQFKATSTNYMDEIGQRPVVSAITPNVGVVSGGTQLVVIGRHLGIEATDIVEFTVCGCDLKDHITYESTMRLYCTTKAWPGQTGDVAIETTSGGRTVVKNAFSFVENDKNLATVNLSNGTTVKGKQQTPTAIVTPAVTVSVTPPTNKDASSLAVKNDRNNSSLNKVTSLNTSGDDSYDSEQTSIGGKTLESPTKTKYKNKKEGLISRHVRHNSETVSGALLRDPSHTSWNNEELIAEVNRLELENKALKLESQEMKAYIERLLAKVMTYCPQALENETDT